MTSKKAKELLSDIETFVHIGCFETIIDPMIYSIIKELYLTILNYFAST